MLKTIKQLSVHGSSLYDELYEKETELRVQKAIEQMEMSFPVHELYRTLENQISMNY